MKVVNNLGVLIVISKPRVLFSVHVNYFLNLYKYMSFFIFEKMYVIFIIINTQTAKAQNNNKKLNLFHIE